MTWIQTASGRAFDLLAPSPDDIDLVVDLPEALAREPRFGGHVRAGSYSVAQHCVLGCDIILADTDDTALAAAFLLHDAHKAYCKDIPSPLAVALEARVAAAAERRMKRAVSFDARWLTDNLFSEALAAQKADIDRAIHHAIGLPWPLSPEMQARVKAWDLAMLVTERRQLLGKSPRPWHSRIEDAAPARLRGRIRVWPWPEAADAYRARMFRFFPHLATAPAA